MSDTTRAVGLVDLLGTAAGEARKAARIVPGFRLVESHAEAVGESVLRAFKRRLDEIEGPVVRPQPQLGERMGELLKRSIDNTPADSRRALHEAILRELVPDEARILSALADGSTYPMVHIAEPGVGSFQKRVLENASSVGRAAGVALPHRTHIYVAHLRRLGLVESGAEDGAIREEYDILLTDQVIRSTIERVGKGPRGAKIIRRTVCISDLGLELWEATRDQGAVTSRE